MGEYFPIESFAITIAEKKKKQYSGNMIVVVVNNDGTNIPQSIIQHLTCSNDILNEMRKESEK